MRNIILSTDSYKQSHFNQYPPGAQFISSYIEARKQSDRPQFSVFFGLQAFLSEYLTMPIQAADIVEAKELCLKHGLPFNEEGWRYILEHHDGYLPIEIQALPEGSFVPRGTPMIQVKNTDPKVPWLTSFVETALLRAIWYPTSVATISFITKAIIYDGLKRSSDDPDGQIPFKLHDFGARGVSSGESAMLGGMAHLVNFKGTDTLEAIQGAMHYYDAQEMPGFSIPASEHSTMTSWGQDREADAYSNMIDNFGHGLFSVVSDSYDLFNAVENIFGDELKEKILNIDGTLVIRPDSGDPVETPVAVIKKLWDIFGGTTNSKGFKVLDKHVRVIQGDGMTPQSVAALVARMLMEGFSIDNIAFGMGGGLLQSHKRDDQRFAMKANAIDFGNGWQDVQKKPATDPSKSSKAGRVAVVMNDGEFETIREDALPEGIDNQLQVVFRNGDFITTQSWEQITDRAHKSLVGFVASTMQRVNAEVQAAA
ncbi:nicotinamide phosphoribosyltransferase [Rhizobium sp. AN5]|uniref:nicotinate phosphoribosyltransferase n=1 Tax=Rhizobium sp. AN5 TaxID=1855304 RepID=UPI000BCABFDE|nr:nicotinate phosphoribosyltransferase [Rhizobium sp. AN5]SOC90068.1 nicotinamide phosphoribosyltransferase [Rhizobium sp. AN5]